MDIVSQPPSSSSSPGSQPLIRVQGVSKSFGPKKVLDNITFEVAENEVLAIIGTSGCGKSTLLRLISGLETPDTGTIELGDPNFTMVFQYSALFDSLTVFENIAFSLMETPDLGEFSSKKGSKPQFNEEQLRDLVREKLRLVGLEGIENLYPNELSGGMQKRVSFARAIVSNPRIILYDEPTAGLDPVASKSLEEYILKLRRELGAASIVVTHEFHTIFRTADRICLLHKGKIQWMGKPAEFLTTDDPVAQEFASAGMVPQLGAHS